MAKINQGISSSTITSGNEIDEITLEDLDEEQRQVMEKRIKAITEEMLMRSCIRTCQGVVLKPGPPPKFSIEKVTSNPPNPSLAIQKVNDHCVDASATSSFASIQYAYNTMEGSMGVYTADSTGISYMQSLADGMTGRDTGLTAPYADQTVPTIAGQAMPYCGQIKPPVAD